MDNTAQQREEARQWEARRLENGRRMKEVEEKPRIAREKREEEERRGAAYERQLEKEIAEEEARRRAEEEKLLQLEHDLCLRRGELFNYKFGDKIRLDSFRGLPIDDVTEFRIGVFGPAGSGRSAFINTCERVLRETDEGTAPIGSSGRETTIILQDYLPEMFFRLVDTRGFFSFAANELAAFENILSGKLQSGQLICLSEGAAKAAQVDLYQNPPFANRIHGVIIVVSAASPRLREGVLTHCLQPFREILRKAGNISLVFCVFVSQLVVSFFCLPNYLL